MRKEVIQFEIERLDPLGQGVSKIDDKICFIAKTLPGEKGTAELTGKKKGVYFARLIGLTKKSPNRTTPNCEHFSNCAGCNYLHTDYTTEILNKIESLSRQLRFSSFKDCSIECHQASERMAYRNRIQLHYDIAKKQLGFFKNKSRDILEVPSCQLPLTPIQIELKNLYQDKAWLTLVPPNSPAFGHVELYEKDNSVQLSWNKPYADGGFTQVNPQMNKLALDLWKDFYSSLKAPKKVYDIFGGSGNLSKHFTNSQVTILDSFCDEKLLLNHQKFKQVNLYKNPIIPSEPADLLIFDPPRSGFKELHQWVAELKPKYIGYQSCFPDTMIRDLKKLPSGWKMMSIHLLDFFPGTHHFEAIAFLTKTD